MTEISALADKIIKTVPELKIRLNEPMREHTSFRIGGLAAAVVFPASYKELTSANRLAREFGVKPLIIGNGTNLLVSDGELQIFVIKTFDGLGNIKLAGDNTIEAGSGVLLNRLAVFALENSLTGLEFAHGIPGTLGGGISMNAGAYGGEMKDVVVSTTALKNGSDEYKVSGEEHAFSYRHSLFSDTGDVIISSVLKLVPGDPAEIKKRMDELSQKRRDSQPLNMPSAGSTFKRPKEGYAAAMIEQAGLKGYAVGGAQVSEKHAGFVINRGGATFDDVLKVVEYVQETVFKKFNVMLEPEIKIIR